MLVAEPNLTTDRILTLDELRPGDVLRFSSARIILGGKGVNVARVAAALDPRATLVGLAPGRTGPSSGSAPACVWEKCWAYAGATSTSRLK